MPDISEQNVPFYWSFKCLEGFYQAGARHIVISPGSRSTPLTMAAAVHDGFKKHVILDERSAAFFALGIGKATGIPALLICTSGTAVANYFPGIIEARKSSVPLIALTADRPPRLHGTGANQTITQKEIFGSYPILFKDVGLPSAQKLQSNELQDAIDNCIKNVKTQKGPAHLNFPFDKPLEPQTSFVETIRTQNSTPGLAKSKPHQVLSDPAKFEEAVIKEINDSGKPIVVIGQLPGGVSSAACFELADKINAPVFSEAEQNSAGLSVRQFDGLLRNNEFLDELKPDLILRFGLQPAGKGLLQALKYWKPTLHIYFSVARMWSDVASSATQKKEWNGNSFELKSIHPKEEYWLKFWKKEEFNYIERSATLIETESVLTDGHVYHILSSKIPEDWFVFFSNSLSARDRSLFGQWNTQQVFTNRGVSGIDGITSTAMGISVALETPGILFTGDLAFLHDTNALLNHTKLSQPLVVVVINNGGGSIFRMLPIAEHEEYFNTYFETPQQADIAKLAASYEIDCTQVESLNELQKLNINKLVKKSSSKLHVVECVTDPNQSMKLRNELWGKG